MLKYMYDNYLDKFEWFMRLDDDVYLKAEIFLRFEEALAHRSSGSRWKNGKDELLLNNDEFFCMAGPDVIMSNIYFSFMRTDFLFIFKRLGRI